MEHDCGTYPVGSLGVGVALVLEEQPRDVGMTLLGRAQQRRLALFVLTGNSFGVRAGLEEALGSLELAEVHLRDEWGLARERVLALERRGPCARDEEAFAAVLQYY